MRILIVTEDVPVAQLGGAGKHAVLLANALLEAGHHVEMLGRVREANGEANNGFVGTLHALIDFRRTGWKEGALGAFLPMRRAHMARRIWRAIRKLGPDWDVIHYHGHFPMLGALVPPAINFVHTLHDQGAECITKMRFRDGMPCTASDPRVCAACATTGPNAVQQTLSAWAVRSYREAALRAYKRHKAVFVSRFVAERFAAVSDPEGLCHTYVVHNFIDASQLQQVAMRARQRGPSERPRLLIAGRIDVAKGFRALFDALPDEAFARIEFVVAGDGPELASLRARFAVKGVCFLGWRALDEVLELTATADACVVPSILEEACATTILEALALGRPVFALARGGTPELARYSVFDGQLRLYDDLPSLASALVDIQRVAAAPAVGTAADVRQRLPQLIEIYRE